MNDIRESEVYRVFQFDEVRCASFTQVGGGSTVLNLLKLHHEEEEKEDDEYHNISLVIIISCILHVLFA